MATYKPEPQTAMPLEQAKEIGRAMDQHRAQNPIALANKTAKAMYAALETAAQTQDTGIYNAQMTVVWEGIGEMQQIATRQHQGFENSYALAMSLAAELNSLIIQLTTADESERGEAVQQFADRIERETLQAAQELMERNAADTMVRGDVWDINADDAETFIRFLLTGQLETSTFRVLGQMLPQLEARMQAIGARK